MELEDIKIHIESSLANLVNDQMVYKHRESGEINREEAIDQLIEKLIESKKGNEL